MAVLPLPRTSLVTVLPRLTSKRLNKTRSGGMSAGTGSAKRKLDPGPKIPEAPLAIASSTKIGVSAVTSGNDDAPSEGWSVIGVEDEPLLDESRSAGVGSGIRTPRSFQPNRIKTLLVSHPEANPDANVSCVWGIDRK